MLLITCLILTGCPKRPSKPVPEIPHRRPPIVHPNSEQTPELIAANEMIRSGINSLEEDDLEKAEWHFQEAVRIASSYGPAYYWLARAKYELEELPRAWDLLDRAEILTGHEPEWLERIDALRAAISDTGQ